MIHDPAALIEAARKFRQEEREIYALPADLRGDLLHTHLKLGQFLADALGKAWCNALTEASGVNVN